MYDFDNDWDIFLDQDDFAQVATIGIKVDVPCVFDTESEVVSGGDSSLRGYAPTLTVYEGDVNPSSCVDELVTDITNTSDNSVWPYEYRVIDIESDGTGMLTLILTLEN